MSRRSPGEREESDQNMRQPRAMRLKPCSRRNATETVRATGALNCRWTDAAALNIAASYLWQETSSETPKDSKKISQTPRKEEEKFERQPKKLRTIKRRRRVQPSVPGTHERTTPKVLGRLGAGVGISRAEPCRAELKKEHCVQ